MNSRTELSKWIVVQSLVPVDITDKVSSLICMHIHMHNKCDQSWDFYPYGCI